MRHFDEELDELRRRLLEMSGLVEDAIYRSVQFLVDGEDDQAQQVLRNEARINQMEMEIDDLATRLLALQQPLATDLRFVTAAIKINSDLERMGDLAVNIVERALWLRRESGPMPSIDIPHMAKRAQAMVRNSLDAFVRRDAVLAQGVLLADDAVDDLRDTIYEELIRFMQENPGQVRRAVNLMFIARNLERLADHATNVAEDILYLIQGIDVRHHTLKPVEG